MIAALIFLVGLCVLLILALYYVLNKLTELQYGLTTIQHELSASQKIVIDGAWSAYLAGDSDLMGYKLPEYEHEA